MLNFHRNSNENSCDTSDLRNIKNILERLEKRVCGNTQLLKELISKSDVNNEYKKSSPTKDFSFFPANNVEELDSLCNFDNIVSYLFLYFGYTFYRIHTK